MDQKDIDKNPFANPDGSPIDGKEPEFFAWGEEQFEKKLAAMSSEERRAALESAKALADRMNS